MVFSIPKMHKYASFMAYSAFVILSQHFIKDVDAHGFMSTPRTRNQFAAEEGLDGGSTAGLPDKEYCSHCLNSNNKVCGKSTNFDYDDYKDSSGNPMPWISQENYVEGQVVTVKSYLDTHHNGHMELRACSLGSLSTQECFDTAGHELIFQEDVLYGMPADPSYPERGYYAGGQGGGLKDFEMRFKLPDGIYGDEIMIQYKYITANSCSPPGYNEYFNGANSKNEVIDSSYWTSGLGLCTPPYPNDGTRGMTWPEQFFNCAEVSIGESSPTPPTPPTTPSPTKQPIPSPVQSPTVTGSGCCSWSPYLECTQLQNTWCQESVDRCEGPCSGIWLTSDPPAPSPVVTPSPTSSPNGTPPPTPSPNNTENPISSPHGCCSINFKTCHHPVGAFCWESEENCIGPCGKYWLPTGNIDGCTAQWEPCTNDDECCAHALCANDGVCRADTWSPPTSPPPSPPSPPSPITTSPFAQTPTRFPTMSPTKIPSNAPSVTTEQPVNNSDHCCTFDLYHCSVVGMCNESSISCQATCGGAWIKKLSYAMSCINKYGECTSSPSACCGTSSCEGNMSYKQCV